MRESRASGFVRGAHSDMRPYRDLYLAVRYALLGMWPKVGFSDNCAERGVSTASLLRAAGYTVTCRRDDGTGFLGEDADRYLEAI